ncbi:CPBP family intramembrane glutamic endopeptidase [Croceicoccus ponticola]|nr:CPBP family intramembrane glutamic endopeptidase [Croceicoccus ponticola]
MPIRENRSLQVGMLGAVLVSAAIVPGIGVLFALACVVLSLVLFPASRGPTFAMAWRSPALSVLFGTIVGVMTGLTFSLVIEPLLAAWTGDPVDLSDFDAVRGNMRNYLILMAVGLGFGGVVEEIVFRGHVIGWGRKVFGEQVALPLAIVSACVFGIAHMYQGWSGVLSTGAIGLIFGLLYVACGCRLLPCIAAHMATNAVGITLIYLG